MKNLVTWQNVTLLIKWKLKSASKSEKHLVLSILLTAQRTWSGPTGFQTSHAKVLLLETKIRDPPTLAFRCKHLNITRFCWQSSHQHLQNTLYDKLIHSSYKHVIIYQSYFITNSIKFTIHYKLYKILTL